MEQILLAYGLPKETVAAIMMLYKNTKVEVRSSDGDRLFRHCSRCAARRYISLILVYCLSRLRISNVYRFNERKQFHTGKKKRNRRYLVQTISGVDYTDDIALLANTLAQAESLLHSLQRATGSIDFHVNRILVL